ncbi:aminotransferase class V-fold PLP-dependent enzyme [Pseudanabaena yagii GIHE-NHR1]|uniref:Aminotransferase class V-fold PLP-dependent enzyme n=2 Tax=Pseudanabaena TaxID=1152 RepID=A0ABX1M125_9CYAN|nr:aminotransferase class V-fold PLP-dependent enzyme [Pseudanabaena yagii GIHE-NHR1]
MHRSHFPALEVENRTYFNYGGQGVLCGAALESITKNFHHIEQLGCFSNAAGDWMMAEYAATKEAIAQEFQVSANTITLTENTTIGCNIALWAVDWQQGDHLLLSDCEHHGIIASAVQIQKRFGVEIDYFPLSNTRNASSNDKDSTEVVDLLVQHLQPKTRLVMLSHICWNTGQVLPLTAMVKACHEHHVLVAVDAAQSVGVLSLNLGEIAADFYAFTTHKWWCAPLGLGALYIRPEIFDQIEPVFVGWRGLTGKTPIPQWKQDGARFEVASSTYTLYEALRLAIAHANSWGTQQQRYQRICELSQLLWQQLNDLPHIDCVRQVPPESGLVSFQINRDIAKSAITQKSHGLIARQLESEHQVFIRALPEPDCLRASVHYLTTMADLDRLVSIIATLA